MNLTPYFSSNVPKVLTELDIKINALHVNLDLDFEQLKAISKGLHTVYDVHYHNSKTGSIRNFLLITSLKKAVNLRQRNFDVRFAVMSSLANKACKMAICELFENAKTKLLN